MSLGEIIYSKEKVTRTLILPAVRWAMLHDLTFACIIKDLPSLTEDLLWTQGHGIYYEYL
jgi:hypothetical protein